MIKKIQRSSKQLFNYSIVGLVNNSVGYAVYLLMTYLGATPKLTMTLLYCVGATIGYTGNRNLTFAYEGNVFGSSVRYFIAYYLGYCINLAILVVFVDKLDYAHQWIQAIAIFVVAGFLFIALKFFVFMDSNKTKMGKL